ncbi:unnamed protein product [Staurois parvus]|uniref:Uncharacterized protein n=1 Tax=Staurois parvus TaxID=386267 RepID=A0ABN9CHG2_9NEOB|nr:unnamed protein product [Staurois parvus]
MQAGHRTKHSGQNVCEMSLFVIFKFLAIPSPIRPDAHRGRNPDDRCWRLPDYIAGDTAGGTSQEHRTR